MNEYVFINGKFTPSEEAKIPVSDLAFLRGYGIFDFFKVIDGRPVFMEDHLTRFENSAKAMSLAIGHSREELRQIIEETIKLHPCALLGIKIVLTGGYSPDGYRPAETSNMVVVAKPFEFRSTAVRLMTYEYQREFPDIKTLNYIAPIKMFPKLRASEADDYLYHTNGCISEAARSNIFIIKDKKLITPATGVLPGVTRKHVIAAANAEFEISERDVTLAETLSAEEVFMTSSSQRVAPVLQIDDRIIGNGAIGAVTIRVQELFLEEEQQHTHIELPASHAR